MSTIRKTPYIESTVALLSDEQKTALLSVLNTATPVSTQASFLSLTEGINPVIFTLPNSEVKNGILINTDDLKLLICYATSEQTLELLKLNTTNDTYEKVDEYLDINELRRVLADAGVIDVIANPTGSATADLSKLDVNGTIYGINGLNYLTTAPESANTSGQLKIVVLSSDPTTKYDGYLYIITE